MKAVGKIFCLLATFVCVIAAHAIVGDGGNPYQPIVERNIFGLHDPPPPLAATPEEAPAVKITLTGIATFSGQKNAFLEWPEDPQPVKPGQPPVAAGKHYAMLTEDRRDGIVHVISIDDKAGIVKIKNNGKLETLNFEKNGAKPPVGSPFPQPTAFGVPPPPSGGIPPVSLATPVGYGSSGASTVTTIGNSSGTKQIPSRQLRLPTTVPTTTTTTTTTQTAQPAKSLEQQVIELEVERELTKNDPKYPPLPPTPLNPDATKIMPSPPPPPGPR